MIKKSTPYANNPGTTSDAVLREVSDLYGKSLRVSDAHSVVDSYFSHFRAEYDIQDRPTRVKYYHGTSSRRSMFQLGMADTLGGKYFKLFTAPDNHLFTFWFNLDGASSQPVVANTHQYIEINVSTGDYPELVATALKLTIDGLYSNYFYCLIDTAKVQIEIITSQLGECSDSQSGTTGFVLTQVAGTQSLIQDIEIEYDGTFPLFNGEVLKNYSFDIYSGKFLKNIEVDVQLNALNDSVSIGDSEGDTLDINADGSINVKFSPRIITSQFSEVLGVVTGITTEVLSFVATSNVLMQKIETSGTNIAEYELTIDSVTQDKKRTYFGSSLNCVFGFDDGLSLVPGQVVKLLVLHNRPTVGDFNARIQLAT